MKFECGQIIDGEYAGLYVLLLADCMMNSAWDFPSFVMSLGLDHLYDGDCYVMHPTLDDVRLVASAIDLDPDEYDDFINNFPLSWDT